MIIIFIHEWHKKHWLAVLVTWDISCVGRRHFDTLHRCHHRHRHHPNEHARMFLDFPWSLIIITFWIVFNSFWYCWASRRGPKLSNSSLVQVTEPLLTSSWIEGSKKGTFTNPSQRWGCVYLVKLPLEMLWDNLRQWTNQPLFQPFILLWVLEC